MMAKLIRLLALIAVLLMPLEMTPAGAASHHGATAAMSMQHCPEQGSNHASCGFGECMMACAAALPASELRYDEPQRIARLPIERPLARAMTDLYPDIATPPPRQS